METFTFTHYIIIMIVARVVLFVIERRMSAFKSDKDLMERFIVFEHRRSRKQLGKQPLY